MAARTPEKAVDAFLERVRTTLACLTTCAAFGSGNAPGVLHVLTAFETGAAEANSLRLVTHEGTGEIVFRFVHRYHVVHLPEDAGRGLYKVSTLGYQYRLTDIAGSDIAIYDWHPEGERSVVTPHLHVLAAKSVYLAQEPGSRQEGKKTYLGAVHFPTARIFLEDIAELLIRDFAVVPGRNNWQEVLQSNREAIQRDRTW